MQSRFRPVIRVFVSSTFSDLKEERNVLQSEVFPRLEHYCLARGFQFQAIDLRWGVPGEAGRDHRTMQICFDELRRAQEVSPRPNFLVLLGDRYGWQPLVEDITETEFLELEKAAIQLDEEASHNQHAGDSATQLLRTWYRRDENADPVRYTLRSRNEWPNGQQSAPGREDEAWKRVEAVLWAVINRAFPPEGLATRFEHIPGADEPLPSIVKFQASATEQEIWRGALAVRDAPEHVVAWYRTICNRRDFLGDARAKDFFDPNEALHVATGELREELSRKLHKDGEEDIKPVEVDLRVSEHAAKLELTRDHLKAMCDEIEAKLVRIIEREIAAYWQPTSDSASAPTPKDTGGPSEARKLELEQRAHELFGESRAPKDGFVGRDQELEVIARYLSDEDDRKPLVVYGPSGTGKTALLARAAQSAAGGGRRIIVRFLGTTPQSSNLRSLLSNLCRALRELGEVEKDIPADLRELQNEFDRLLALATEEKPILLFLDALDQLDEADGARQTYWLRTPLPPHVKVMVSCIYDPEGQEALNKPYHALERRKLLDGAIAIESLTAGEAMTLFDIWLRHGDRRGQHKRWLSDAQREAIAARITPDAAVACRRPLYLRILSEECRLWPSWKPMFAADLGENTTALMQSLFDRLAAPAVHGHVLVESVLSYIASARRGLSENEILEVLWADPDYKKHLDEQGQQTGHSFPSDATRIPIAIWSRLRHDLDPYLAEQAAPGGAVLNFYHREVECVVCGRYLAKGAQRIVRHQRLANYFQGENLQPWWHPTDGTVKTKDGAPRTRLPNARKADELPMHWLTVLQSAAASRIPSECGNATDAIEKLFRCFDFIEAKTEAGLVFDLVVEFAVAIERTAEDRPAHQTLMAFGKAVEQEVNVLANHPQLAWQQLCNRLRFASQPARQLVAAESDRRSSGVWPSWIELRTPIRGTENLLAALHAHDGVIWSCAASPNGKLFATAGADGAVRVWASGTFKEVSTLRHDEMADASRVDGLRTNMLNALGSSDNTAWIDDTIHSIRRTANEVIDCAFDRSSTLVVTRLCSETIVAWDVTSGVERWAADNFGKFLGQTKISFEGLIRVTRSGASMVVNAAQNIVLAPRADHFAAWDIRDGSALGAWQIRVAGIATSPDLEVVVVAELDAPGRVFALYPRTNVSALLCQEGEEGLASCTISSSPPLLVTGGRKGQIILRNPRSCEIVARQRAGENRVTGCSISPNGRYLIAELQDAVTLWTLPDLREHASINGLSKPVAFSPDSHSLVGRVAPASSELAIRDLETGQETARLVGHSSKIRCCSYTTDGKKIISASDDGTVIVWDAWTMRQAEVPVPRVHSGFLRMCTFSADGQTLMIADDEGLVQLRDANTLRQRASLKAEAHTKWAIGPDGSKLVSAGKSSIKLWESATGRELASLPSPANGPLPVNAQCAISPDGRRAAIRYDEKRTLIWNLMSLQTTSVETDGVLQGACTFTPDARWLLTNEMWCVSVRTPDTGFARGVTVDPAYRSQMLMCFAVSPGGDYVIGGDYEGRVKIWDWPPEALTVRGLMVHLLPAMELRAGASIIDFCAVGAGGRLIASAGQDGIVKIWDARNGDVLSALPVGGVASIALHPARPFLVVGTQSGDVLFADLRQMPTGPRSSHGVSRSDNLAIRSTPAPIRAVPQAPEPDAGVWLQRMEAVHQRRQNDSEE